MPFLSIKKGEGKGGGVKTLLADEIAQKKKSEKGGTKKYSLRGKKGLEEKPFFCFVSRRTQVSLLESFFLLLFGQVSGGKSLSAQFALLGDSPRHP